MFTHLHLHTEYSLLDGMGRISDLVARARELGMDSLAITDHGAMYGVVEFYQAARAAGIKPILGCEVYVAPQGRHSRNPADKVHNHLVLLAKNEAGYRNLLQLVTKANLEGFYYKPRVDKELLAAHSEGLVALSACVKGEVAQLALQGRREEAEKAAGWYRDVFGDFYLELQEHALPEQAVVNRELVALSRELNIPLVATNDVHYVNQSDASAHGLLLCIQTNTTVLDERRMKMAGDSFYLKSPQEMAALFPELPEVVTNTQRIAEMCNLDLEFNRLHLPEIERPAGLTPDDYLAELCWQGLRRRYPEITPEIENRLRYELDVIRQTQFANYFLVVWDFVRFARERGILFGVRGSAAASIVLYCLGITDIDPLATRLVFERFLNVERREMPDIDMDFADDRRDEVIAYVANRYGHDHVAQIITFGTLGARAALRDVGRALGMTYSDVDRVARLVPTALNMTIDRALQESPELADLYGLDEAVKKLVDAAKRLEGIARHASTHAAGVVISSEPLTQYVPLQRPNKGDEQGIAMTQFAMEDIARIGLLKMDFLGLTNLTSLGKARDLINATRNANIDLQRLPLDDTKTFELLSSGETTGVFQLESAGMRRYIQELKPTCLSDLAAMVALYRPGPMQHIPTFIKKKHGQEPITYPHPALANILEETYGVIVYQDQVLLIAQAFAGYTLGEADVVRKAMGKKIPEKMREERQKFIDGAKRKGFSEDLANEIFDLVEPFAGYAFNKAHSVCYAMIAYQTAYLKANYPAEYMAALLSMHADQPEKVAQAVAECNRLGLTVLPPRVNESGEDFTIEGEKAIRFGLKAIKNVGSAPIQAILEAREKGGRFTSIEDFCRRVDLRGMNKRVLESLIKVGVLDDLGTRGALLNRLDRLISFGQQEQRLQDSGQLSFMSLGVEIPEVSPKLDLTDTDAPLQEKLAWEKELTGVYLSEHPFRVVAQQLAAATTAFCGQIDEEMNGQSVVVAGMVATMRQLSTKDHRPFVMATLEDMAGAVEVTVWPETYERTRDLWKEGAILLVQGKVKMRNDQVQLVCDRAQLPPSLEEMAEQEAIADIPAAEPEPPPEREAVVPARPKNGSGNGHSNGRAAKPYKNGIGHRLFLHLTQSDNAEADLALLREVFDLLHRYPGADPVHLIISSNEETVQLEAPETVGYCAELYRSLTGLVPQVRVEEAK